MISSRYYGSIKLHLILKLVGGFLIFWLVVLLLHLTVYGAELEPSKYVLVSLLIPVAALLEFFVRDKRCRSLSALTHGEIWTTTQREVLFVLVAVFGVIVMSKDADLSRVALATFVVLYSAWISWMNSVGHRILQRALYENSQKGRANAVVLASPSQIEKNGAMAMTSTFPGADFLGYVPFGSNTGSIAATASAPILGDFSSLREICRDYKVRMLVTLGLEEKTDLIKSLQELCDSMGMRLIWSDDKRANFRGKMDSHLSGSHLYLTNWSEPLEDPLNRFTKRIFDLVFAGAVSLIVVPPLCAAVWTLHRLFSPGPLFYTQKRTGRNGELFDVLKFRSMHINDCPGKQAEVGDSRFFPGSSILRKCSIDEMPQFLNVLRGEMSVVGPRPHFIDHDVQFATLVGDYPVRHFAKPGITGLAQVKGLRGEIENPLKIKHRIRLDHFYLRHWSPLLDICIICETARQVIFPPKSAR